MEAHERVGDVVYRFHNLMIAPKRGISPGKIRGTRSSARGMRAEKGGQVHCGGTNAPVRVSDPNAIRGKDGPEWSTNTRKIRRRTTPDEKDVSGLGGSTTTDRASLTPPRPDFIKFRAEGVFWGKIRHAGDGVGERISS